MLSDIVQAAIHSGGSTSVCRLDMFIVSCFFLTFSHCYRKLSKQNFSSDCLTEDLYFCQPHVPKLKGQVQDS